MPDGKPLVIVESPTKARKIASFLGDDYIVESSVGHVRDLPANASEIPAAYKGEPWARLGIDVDNDFKPLYVISKGKREHVRNLKKLAAEASELYLATDEDREGEAIAWHLTEVLNPRVPVRRMVFHEITERAIREALANPRDIDRRLVDAQEARRILDRLYGYEMSPVLWKKVAPGLSAGRVQSVATRIIVERERERIAFRPARYSSVEATLATGAPTDAEAGAGPGTFTAPVVVIDGARVATGRDFDNQGRLTTTGTVVLEPDAARSLADRLGGLTATVRSVERKPYTRRPPAPFETSTLQQEAGRKLRFSVQRTMQVAQRLYENGYITYMRTDSVTLSEEALAAARDQIARTFGAEYVPEAPRVYTSRVKNAQEAHEAIRPAGEVFRSPAEVASELSADEAALYELIWQRTLASQMPDARGETVSVRIDVTLPDGTTVELATTGRTITFPGFLRAYVEGSDDPEADLADRERRLPPLTEGQTLTVAGAEAADHQTRPPARYTEASLVQRLKELGVGRPSTWASIVSTIQDRGYVRKQGSALVPSYTAFAVTQLLERHFPDLVDYAFTARMEDDLDNIATGQAEAVPWLRSFYFGSDEPGLREKVSERLSEIDAREVNSLPLGTDADGNEIVVRVGRYGPYLQRGEQTVTIPDDIPPDELTVERAVDLLEAPDTDRHLGDDPETGLPVWVRRGRYGPYVQLGAPDGKPERTQSLLDHQTPETITLDEALQLLSLPRVVGEHPSGGEITAQIGRYGPYLKWGSETRSLEQPGDVFTITLDEAVRILSEPRRRRGARTPKVLATLGEDPATGRPMELREGRYGPYVTDGETNASLGKIRPEDLTPERAAELLAARRERGPAKGRGRSRGTSKGSSKRTSKGSSKGSSRRPSG